MSTEENIKILIPQDVAEAGKDYLRNLGYEIVMGTGIGVDDLIKDVQGCQGIILRGAEVTKEVIAEAKDLKIIARSGSGYDNVDCDAAADAGIWVTNAPESTSLSVAEQTIGLMIACARNMYKNTTELRTGNFGVRREVIGVDLEGKTLGLIGLGHIGKLVAQKAALGFNMKVVAYDPFIDPQAVDEYITINNNWDEVFQTSDVISLHLPATEKTAGIVGKSEFDMMKPSAFLINCARGEVVNEVELIEALKRDKIRGAGLDVFAQEPPAKDNPLFQLENVMLMPHNSTYTEESEDRMALHAAYEIERILNGDTPKWPVNQPKILSK